VALKLRSKVIYVFDIYRILLCITENMQLSYQKPVQKLLVKQKQLWIHPFILNHLQQIDHSPLGKGFSSVNDEQIVHQVLLSMWKLFQNYKRNGDTYVARMYNRLQHVQFQEIKKTSCTKLPALDNPKYSTANSCKTHYNCYESHMVNLIFYF